MIMWTIVILFNKFKFQKPLGDMKIQEYRMDLVNQYYLDLFQ